MDNQPEVTRADLDETRDSLSEKLATLQQQVVHSVHGATNAVNETVATVKDAVHDTVASVKETFDLSLQVKRHPWGMVAGSIAFGYLGGYLLRRSGSKGSAPASRSPSPSSSSSSPCCSCSPQCGSASISPPRWRSRSAR